MNATYQHLAAYVGSVTNGVSNMDIALVNDGILTKQNNHAILPQDGQLLLAVVLSADANRARLNTPSVRYVGLPSIVPVNASATVPATPSIYDMTDAPLAIPRADEIAIEGTQDNAGAQTMNVGILFGFGRREIPNGPRYRVRGTATIVGVTGAWANGSIVMDTILPRGTYAVVGLDVTGTGLFLARLIFPGTSYRPGVLCRPSPGIQPAKVFTSGTLGVYGEFDSTNVPNLEILQVAANTAQVVYMDVVRIGS